MKTFTKIMRSILTSLLFLIITVAIIVQFGLTCIRLNGKNLPDIIDRNLLLDTLLEEEITNAEVKNLADEFLKDYINYIFHKRSFPSLQTVNFSNIDEADRQYAERTISNLSDKIGLEYETVIFLRNTNNVVSNGAIYLLINIGIFFLYVILSIEQLNFKKSAKLFSISLFSSGLVAMIMISALPKIISTLNVQTQIMLSSIATNAFLSKSFNLALFYLGMGIIIFAILYCFDRFIVKKDRS